MKISLLKYIIIYVVLVVLQVFILDNIQLNGFINPYIYILFILMLPFDISGWLLLILSFFLGLSIDLFEHTPGLHASATVFLGFCRPGIIRMVGEKEDLEPGQYPNIRDFGTMWFFTYTVILVFLHHLVLFYLEIFRLNEFFLTLLKVIINTAISTILIIIIQFLFYSRTKR